MAITTYAELQTAVNNWAERTDSTAQVKEFIALGEAGLNRKIKAGQTDATLTGTSDSRSIDVSSLKIVEAFDLFHEDSTGTERKLQKQRAGEYPIDDTSGDPSIWSVDGDNIVFERPLSAADSFRLRYRGRFALSDSVTSNWLLTNHPDVYLAACMVWGHGYHEALQNFAVWKSQLIEAVDEIQLELSRLNKGTLRVDPALQIRQRYDYRVGE